MRYILSMVLAFASGAFQIKVAAELANDAGESVLTWLAVAVLGLILFFQAITMALVSVQEERAEQLLEEEQRA